MLIRSLVLSLSLVILPLLPALATTSSNQETDDAIAAFANMKRLTLPPLTIPTVVDLPVSDSIFQTGNLSSYFAIFEETSQSFQPAWLIVKAEKLPINWQVSSNGAGSPQALIDRDPSTSVEFEMTENGDGYAAISFTSPSTFTATGLTLALDRFVALPRTIEVRVNDGGDERVVLATTTLTDRVIRFPETTARNWSVRLGYSQPLRLTGLSFFEENPSFKKESAVRFLARPNERYVLYFGADRPIFFRTGESPNLADDREVLRLGESFTESNPKYRIADSDGDGVPDVQDNCINQSNPDQRDENGNGRGDQCDDYDRDSIINAKDNCIDKPNASQKDTDSDGRGDVCDGVESRLTERFPWGPTALIALASIVIAALFVSTFRHMKRNGN